MHELGVVFYVIDAVEDVAKHNNVSHIHSVTVEIGEVSTVIPEYLLDVWKWAAQKHEMLTDCELLIERIDAKVATKHIQPSNTAKYVRTAAVRKLIFCVETSLT